GSALSANQWNWSVWTGRRCSVNKNTSQSAGLYVGGTLVSASDPRLEFNEKPLVNALNAINKLEHV
ncbi:MAG: hypothetical protein ACKPKO_00565, partial [Candidatus Fonsibacter sp.]